MVTRATMTEADGTRVQVAVKRFHDHVLHDDALVLLILNEINIARELGHRLVEWWPMWVHGAPRHASLRRMADVSQTTKTSFACQLAVHVFGIPVHLARTALAPCMPRRALRATPHHATTPHPDGEMC